MIKTKAFFFLVILPIILLICSFLIFQIYDPCAIKTSYGKVLFYDCEGIIFDFYGFANFFLILTPIISPFFLRRKSNNQVELNLTQN